MTSASEGKRNRFLLNGALEREKDAFALFYEQEGDNVCLRLAKEGATMTREGEISLEMRFDPTRETQFTLVGCGSEASVPVATTRYKFAQQRNDLFFKLDYEVRYPQGAQKFHLKADVLTLSEEK